MRVLFAGTPEIAVPSAQAVLDAGHDVVGVLTRPPARQGRGRRLVSSAVARWAESVGVPVFTPTEPGDPEFKARLIELQPDVAPVVAYGGLLPAQLLEIPTHGWINLHFSLLPKWRGAAPLQRSIINGDREVGVTTFEIVVALDAGPIYRSQAVPLPELATSDDMFAELSHLGAQVILDTLADASAGIAPTPQAVAEATYASKLTVDEARIDWSQSSRVVHNQIRGNSSHPGAWTLLDQARIKVLRSSPAAGDFPQLAPGELHITKRAVYVGTADGCLELVSVQPVGKRPMPAPDWARGGITDRAVLR